MNPNYKNNKESINTGCSEESVGPDKNGKVVFSAIMEIVDERCITQVVHSHTPST